MRFEPRQPQSSSRGTARRCHPDLVTGSNPPIGGAQDAMTLLHLQRAAGNAAVNRLITRSPGVTGGSAALQVQRTLEDAQEFATKQGWEPIVGVSDVLKLLHSDMDSDVRSRLLDAYLTPHEDGTRRKTVVTKDAVSKEMNRPQGDALLDRVVVRMGKLGPDPKPYPRNNIRDASELTIEPEKDFNAVTRHWLMAFRLAGNIPPGMTRWMQAEFTLNDGYRVLWRSEQNLDLPGKESYADYAGSCNLTVDRVYGSLGSLANSSPEYRNFARTEGSPEPDPHVYSCHTVVRLLNVMLGLNISISTPDKYIKPGNI